MTAGRKKPGRPAGNSNTRERILTSARELFARNGINSTSIRAVAAAADVDSALVHHYFGTKERLFAAAVHIPIDPMDVIGPLREAPLDDLGHRIPSILLALWDSEIGASFIATLRSMLAGPDVTLFRTFIQDVIGTEIGPRVDHPRGSGLLRVELVASQLVGIVLARYIMELEPFASLPAQQVADLVAPSLQRYLTGELPEFPAR